MSNSFNFNNDNIVNALVESLDASYPDVVFKDHVTLGLANHTEFFGKVKVLPVKTGYTTAEATTMDDAVALSTTDQTQRAEFQFTHFTRYKKEDVDLSDAAYSEDPEVAAVDVLIDGQKTVMHAMAESIEAALWSDGFGTMATIKSNTNPSGNLFKLTLKTPTDAWKFAVNQQLVSKATPATGSLDTGVATVTIVDTTGGTITVDGGGTWTPTNTHVLGKNKVMKASTALVTYIGILGFNPDINSRASLGTTFCNVDRSVNPQALAGMALDCTGQSVRQALNNLASQMSNVGGVKIDTGFLNYADYQKLGDDLGNKLVALNVMGEMGVNYEGIRFAGPKGPITIVPGTFVPQGRIQVCDINTLVVSAPGKFIQQKAKNGSYIELQDKDAARLVARANGAIYVTNPAAWGNAII